MGIRVQPYPEHGVVFAILSGAVTPEDAASFCEQLTPADKGRVMIYVEPTADLSGVQVEAMPGMKRTIARRLRELFGEEPVVVVWVCGPGPNQSLIDIWCRYVALGDEHPASPVRFPSLEAACDGLDLPQAAREALNAAVEGATPPEPRLDGKKGAAERPL